VIGEKPDGSNDMDAMLEEYAAISRQVAKKANLQLLDLRKAFISHLKEHNKDNAAKGLLTGDGVHLNAAGNQFVASLMLAALGVEPIAQDKAAEKPGKVLRHVVLFKFKKELTKEEDAGARVVSFGCNRGLGAAVRFGLDDAIRHGAEAVVFLDADREYAPEELERVVGPVLDGTADYVVGSRFDGTIEHMAPHRRLGNVVLTRLLCFVARQRITDGQSGYRALSAQAAADAEIIHDFNYAQVLTLDLLAKGYRYREVPITYRFRTAGDSFIKLDRYLRRVVPAVYRELNDVSSRRRVPA
jgi:glycosyltransferase involved in cell wall biosynthesis